MLGKGEELVKVQLLKDNNRYAKDVLVVIDGESCLMERGTTIEVKKKFADVYGLACQLRFDNIAIFQQGTPEYMAFKNELKKV